jgi:hypothetical protein
MPTIQLVFYWVATISFGLVGLFVLVAIFVLLYIRTQVSKVSRAADATLFEARMAIESAQSRARGFGAGMMSGIFKAILSMIKKE